MENENKWSNEQGRFCDLKEWGFLWDDKRRNETIPSFSSTVNDEGR
jgi:hypothetical protein